MDFTPIAFFTACVVIVYLGVNAGMKKRRMEHEERMLAIERGTMLPPSPPEKKNCRNPYRWPVIFIGLGVAMMAAMAYQGDEDFAWGLLPLLVGIGLYWTRRNMERERLRKEQEQEQRLFARDRESKPPSAEL